ncbi:hypothetical protein KY285_007493 [Solanum tuberosum]|nr:hypothetical protein KY285_007493 [Solanum tuberosum]
MYHYQGSTFIGIGPTTFNDDKEAKMTRLWHMHLGHPGGKSLKTFSDEGLLKGLFGVLPRHLPSLGGKHYFVTFVDDFSRRLWVHKMKTKDEVLGIFLKWKAMIEIQIGRKIKCLRTDNGGEYKNDLFHRQIYTTTEWGGRTHEPNFVGEGLMHVV